MKVYMDVCCYNKPFDNQGDDRIHIESEAVPFPSLTKVIREN